MPQSLAVARGCCVFFSFAFLGHRQFAVSTRHHFRFDWLVRYVDQFDVPLSTSPVWRFHLIR